MILLRFRMWFAGLRWRRFTKHFDRQIAEARKAHRPVNHLLQAKQDFAHAALRGEMR